MVMIGAAAREHAVEAEVQSANGIGTGTGFVSGILWTGKGIVSVTVATFTADETGSRLNNHGDGHNRLNEMSD